MTSSESPPHGRRGRTIVVVAVAICACIVLGFLATRVSRKVGIMAPNAIPKTDGILGSLFSGHTVFFERFDSPRGGELIVFGTSSDSLFEDFAAQAKLDLSAEGGTALNHVLTNGITAFFTESDPTFGGALKLNSGRSVRIEGALHRESGEVVVRMKF